MATPLFSIVIPTRERADTLRHALRTCLNQECDSYEIVVSDNASSPATKSVVDELNSPLVRYVRTPKLLAMSSNWDFALSHALGEYVILIGDDDGLLPHSLGELQKLVEQSKPRAVRWEPAYYTWPNIALPGQGDYLRIPMGRDIREVDGMSAIAKVIAFQLFYTTLPMLYNSAVHRDLLVHLRAKTGRIFSHPIPDIYSGFAIASIAQKYISTSVPMSISGQSGASTGIATLFNRGRSRFDEEFRSLNEKEGLTPDPRVPDLPVFPHVPVADTFVHAKRLLFPESTIDLDQRKLVLACIENLQVGGESDWQTAIKLIRESMTADADLKCWFESECSQIPYRQPRAIRLRPARLGFDGYFLHLDGNACGFADVAGASQFCEMVLNYRRSGADYIECVDDDAESSSGIALPEAQRHRLIESQQRELIDELTQTCAERLSLINKFHQDHANAQRRYLARIKLTISRLMGAK